jgi:hypothetical protein
VPGAVREECELLHIVEFFFEPVKGDVRRCSDEREERALGIGPPSAAAKAHAGQVCIGEKGFFASLEVTQTSVRA